MIQVILIGKFMNFVTPYQESKATLKLLTSLVVVCIVYSLASLLLAYFSGISFWICVIVIALFGFVSTNLLHCFDILLQVHMRILEEEVIGIKSIVSSLRLVSVIIRNTQRQELKSLKATRSELEQKITAMVEKYATPEQRTLDNVQGETTMGAPKKLVPRLIRRNSFSETFL
jgi:cell division protein FtsB